MAVAISKSMLSKSAPDPVSSPPEEIKINKVQTLDPDLDSSLESVDMSLQNKFMILEYTSKESNKNPFLIDPCVLINQ